MDSRKACLGIYRTVIKTMSSYKEVYLKSQGWKNLKASKESKTSKRCAICLSDEFIDLHHLFYRENLNDAQTSDLRWLCRRCHETAHELIKRGVIVFKPEWSHHVMFAITRSKVKQALGTLKIRADKYCDEARRIDSLKTPRGGFTKEAIQKLGVTWPPPKGWRKDMIRESLKSKLKVEC